MTAAHDETPSARTLVLEVPGWPGHLPGQHVDLRLTAEDGYSAERSYSIASAWTEESKAGEGDKIELTIQRVEDGEVSSYLTDTLAVGQQIELRGPIGGWFAWRGEPPPVLLVAGGSGIVPLMSMIRARGAQRGKQPFRLIYSVRTAADILYATELSRRVREDPGLDVHYLYTRAVPEGSPGKPHRINVPALNTYGWPPDFAPDCFVCGPTGFVETTADILVALGHDPAKIRTERFG